MHAIAALSNVTFDLGMEHEFTLNHLDKVLFALEFWALIGILHNFGRNFLWEQLTRIHV